VNGDTGSAGAASPWRQKFPAASARTGGERSAVRGQVKRRPGPSRDLPQRTPPGAIAALRTGSSCLRRRSVGRLRGASSSDARGIRGVELEPFQTAASHPRCPPTTKPEAGSTRLTCPLRATSPLVSTLWITPRTVNGSGSGYPASEPPQISCIARTQGRTRGPSGLRGTRSTPNSEPRSPAHLGTRSLTSFNHGVELGRAGLELGPRTRASSM